MQPFVPLSYLVVIIQNSITEPDLVGTFCDTLDKCSVCLVVPVDISSSASLVNLHDEVTRGRAAMDELWVMDL
jgi:hypothetical protein